MRQIVYNHSITLNDKIRLNKADSHHIVRVLRLPSGSKIKVIDKNNIIYLCKIIDTNLKDGLTLLPIEKLADKYSMNKNIQIDLFFSIIKPNRMEMVFEKCTELNVSNFYPIITENCSIPLRTISENKLKRWNKIIKSAVEQSGRLGIPKLYEIKYLNQIEINNNNTVLLLDETSNIPLFTQLNNHYQEYQNISLFIGPEGSFTDKEKKYITKEFQALPSSISTNTLRSETASIISVAIISHYLQIINTNTNLEY